jgi:hypothetical protein
MHKLTRDGSINYSPYTGSGKVKLFMGAFDGSVPIDNPATKDIGNIQTGTLDFNFANYGTVNADIKLSDLLGVPKSEGNTTITDVQEFDIPVGGMVTMGSLGFVESGDNSGFYYDMTFGLVSWSAGTHPDPNLHDQTEEMMWYLYAATPMVIKGDQSYTKTEYHSDGGVGISRLSTEIDITLVSGWNRIYFESYSKWENISGNDEHIRKERFFSTAPDTSDWKWTISTAFQEMPYLLDNGDKTLIFNITERTSVPYGLIYLPSDPACDRWELESNETFPHDGKWYNKTHNISSSSNPNEYIEFSSSGSTMKLTSDIVTNKEGEWSCLIDTANKIIRYR